MDVGCKQNFRLRSASRGNAFSTWYVGSSGNVLYCSASYADRFSPIVLPIDFKADM